MELGRFREAEAAYERALELEPRSADSLSNLAGLYKEQGRMDEAVGYYDLAVGFAPDVPSIRYNRSLALLKAGDYSRGWSEYEWRWRRGQEKHRLHPGPRWDGSALAGRTVLIWAEQGLGDALQFVRYAPRVKALGGTVIVECPARLKPLFATCPGIDLLVAEGEPLPAHDCQIPMMSLPLALGTTADSIPWDGPYVAAEPSRSAAWGRRLRREPGFKVGVMWQGNPHYRWDRFRSAPLAAFAPLAAVPGVRLFSLQVGPGAAQVAALNSRFAIEELSPDPDPAAGAFLDTAAIVPHLDLVVAIDSSVAHLAGALGARVWMALSAASDWRWGVGRSETAWYPTMRLFRQSALGDWAGVFEQMAVDLAPLAGRRNGECAIPIEIAPGELLDKIAILDLKAARFTDPERLSHVHTELAALTAARVPAVPNVPGLADLERELAAVNAAIWDVEEELRAFERAGEFGAAFVEAARAVYRNNDRRAAVKRWINQLIGSRFIEEKSYPVDVREVLPSREGSKASEGVWSCSADELGKAAL